MRRLPLLERVVTKSKTVLYARMAGDDMVANITRQAYQAIGNAKAIAESRAWRHRPQTINVEVTGICDAACIHCPREDMDRSQKPMDFSLFKKLVDEAAELGVPELVPNGFGEILTMRNADEYLRYIRTKEHPFRISINTNGYRLTDEKIETFIENEVYLLNITLDGATAETFESVRVKLELAQIEDNIHRLLKARRERGIDYPRIRIGMVLIKQNEHEAQALLDKWTGVADFVGIGGFTNRAASRDPADFLTAGQSPQSGASSCVLPFRELDIWSDGRAVLCCDDWNEEHVVGDLNRQSLKEIWHGPELRRARELHAAGRGAEIELCRVCSMWRPPVSEMQLWT